MRLFDSLLSRAQAAALAAEGPVYPGASEDIGDHAVGHRLAVLHPRGAILGRAARVVAERAVQQQQRQEGEEVNERKRAPAARRQAPEERAASSGR